jgi:hypothetical protein
MTTPFRRVVASLAVLAATLPAAAQLPEVREQLEIREVPVLVDLPAAWRDRDVAELAGDLVIVEDGTPRELSAAAPVAPPAGAGFARVTLAVDRLHCSDDAVAAVAPALAALAPRWVALGPVDVVRLGGGEAAGEGTRDAQLAATRIAALTGVRCALEPSAQAPDLAPLACPATPCLLVWVGGGWRGGEAAGVSLDAAARTARTLSRRGWSVIAVGPAVAAEPGPAGKPGTTLPGSDQTTWTVDLLDPRRSAAAGRPAADDRSVDVELAPLRRLVAATAGELALGAEELDRALAAMETRTLLYFRTDRAAEVPAPLEVREAGENGARLSASEWAPDGRD